ncbi:MAG TPA: hypothetical protein VFL59_02850 [Candidatus Nanopelagicales bacterium]|nr:hypothetical protein [Candidatus Nanopelagicales bacterium]
MALSTLHTDPRSALTTAPAVHLVRARRALHTPAAVLLASCALAGAFLVAVSDLASRLG